jgi:hypothetical protein
MKKKRPRVDTWPAEVEKNIQRLLTRAYTSARTREKGKKEDNDWGIESCNEKNLITNWPFIGT